MELNELFRGQWLYGLTEGSGGGLEVMVKIESAGRSICQVRGNVVQGEWQLEKEGRLECAQCTEG